MRRRLVKLIKDSLAKHIGKSCNLAENIADDLIYDKAIVLPCKAGDEVWLVIDNPEPQIAKKIIDYIVFGIVDDILVFTDGTRYTMWSKIWISYYRNIFHTKAEAEYALKNRRSVSLIDGHIEE